MYSEKLNIYEYEEVLTGSKKDFNCSFRGDSKENEAAVGNIWRYAILNILHWTPQMAVMYLNDDIIDKLQLNKTFIAIGYERGSIYKNDYRFILQFAFPEIKYDFKEQTIAEYEKIAKIGRFLNNEEKKKYSKKFFIGTDGIKRAQILMRYVISLYLSSYTIPELYRFFSAKKAVRWLQNRRLGTPLKLIYTTPLEYFHDSLKIDQRDDVTYYQCRISNLVKKINLENSNISVLKK